MAKQEQFNFWRRYNVKPFYRWACVIVEDADTEQGYRVVDHDPHVADGTMLHALSDHFAKSHTKRGGGFANGVNYEETGVIHPGEDGYFVTAVHTRFDMAALMPGSRGDTVGV